MAFWGLQEILMVVKRWSLPVVLPKGPWAHGRYYWSLRVFPVTPQKPWFNQLVAHLHFVLCVWNRFVWVILGVLSGVAARVTATWTMAGAVLVSTLVKSEWGCCNCDSDTDCDRCSLCWHFSWKGKNWKYEFCFNCNDVTSWKIWMLLCWPSKIQLLF